MFRKGITSGGGVTNDIQSSNMDKTLRHIDILLFDGVNILDVAGMAQAFSSTNELAGETYGLRFVSPDGAPVTASCGLRLQVNVRASSASHADDLVVPGGRGVDDLLTNPSYG